MVKPPFAAVVAAVVSLTVAASTLVAQQATPPPTPPAKPSPTAKPTPTQAKPTTPPAKSGTTTAKPAPTTTPTPTPAPPPPPPKPATDVKLKTQYQNGAQLSENMTYLQGPRQRVEFPGVVSIDQCDLKRSVMINTSDKKYRVQPYPEGTAAPAAPAPTPEYVMGGPQAQQPKGGIITMTTTLTDTLERQQMFGLEARHVKSVLVKEPSTRACDKTPLKVEVDAWYVDLPEQSKCLRTAAPPPPPDPTACTDKVETRTVGDVKLGFPVKATTTTTTGEGDKLEVTTSSQTVTELEITRLDKSLFEVPAGYTEANSTAEVVPAVGNGGLADAVFGSTADGTSTAAPKKPGVIRIGVLEPVNHTDRNLSGRYLRQDVVAKMNKGSFDALPLKGTSPAEIQAEAAKLQCDYILFTDITDVKTSKPGGIGGALKKVSGGDGKDKQDVKLDYKLFAVDSTQAPKISGKAQASTGGFGVGSALKVAAFAGQMYMGVMGMGGLTNSMMGLTGMAGGMGGGLGMYDPRASAMASMAASVGMQMAMGGMGGAGGMGGDQSDQDMRNTVSEALNNAAKATMDQLSNTKKK
ncbi:MAG TPA: hypothetical protein VJN96_14340 [Vicinamibacterales bacterium]|nr:hypothetical protein [Vicinamibacterales bacterium]